ncbi:hypothetical protein ABPG74_014897 [Tetrahymena malaccensis]
MNTNFQSNELNEISLSSEQILKSPEQFRKDNKEISINIFQEANLKFNKLNFQIYQFFNMIESKKEQSQQKILIFKDVECLEIDSNQNQKKIKYNFEYDINTKKLYSDQTNQQQEKTHLQIIDIDQLFNQQKIIPESDKQQLLLNNNVEVQYVQIKIYYKELKDIKQINQQKIKEIQMGFPTFYPDLRIKFSKDLSQNLLMHYLQSINDQQYKYLLEEIQKYQEQKKDNDKKQKNKQSNNKPDDNKNQKTQKISMKSLQEEEGYKMLNTLCDKFYKEDLDSRKKILIFILKQNKSKKQTKFDSNFHIDLTLQINLDNDTLNIIYEMFQVCNHIKLERYLQIQQKIENKGYILNEEELKQIHIKYKNIINQKLEIDKKTQKQQKKKKYKYDNISFIYLIIFKLEDLQKTNNGQRKAKKLEDSVKINYGQMFDPKEIFFCKIGYSRNIQKRIKDHIGNSERENTKNYGTYGGKIFRLYRCTDLSVEKNIHLSNEDDTFVFHRIKYIPNDQDLDFDGKEELYIYNDYLIKHLDERLDCLFLDTDEKKFDEDIQYNNKLHKQQDQLKEEQIKRQEKQIQDQNKKIKIQNNKIKIQNNKIKIQNNKSNQNKSKLRGMKNIFKILYNKNQNLKQQDQLNQEQIKRQDKQIQDCTQQNQDFKQQIQDFIQQYQLKEEQIKLLEQQIQDSKQQDQLQKEQIKSQEKQIQQLNSQNQQQNDELHDKDKEIQNLKKIIDQLNVHNNIKL